MIPLLNPSGWATVPPHDAEVQSPQRASDLLLPSVPGFHQDRAQGQDGQGKREKRRAATAARFKPREETEMKTKVTKIASKAKAPARTKATTGLLAMIEAGVIKTNLQLQGKYKGKEFTATTQKDGVLFRGKTFTSFSSAASAAMSTVIGGKPAVDGWLFWRTKDGSKVSDLRPGHVVRTRKPDSAGSPAKTAPVRTRTAEASERKEARHE